MCEEGETGRDKEICDTDRTSAAELLVIRIKSLKNKLIITSLISAEQHWESQVSRVRRTRVSSSVQLKGSEYLFSYSWINSFIYFFVPAADAAFETQTAGWIHRVRFTHPGSKVVQEAERSSLTHGRFFVHVHNLTGWIWELLLKYLTSQRCVTAGWRLLTPPAAGRTWRRKIRAEEARDQRVKLHQVCQDKWIQFHRLLFTSAF